MSLFVFEGLCTELGVCCAVELCGVLFTLAAEQRGTLGMGHWDRGPAALLRGPQTLPSVPSKDPLYQLSDLPCAQRRH